MSKKLVRINENKRMKMAANLVKEEATEAFNGWKFLVQKEKDGYYVGTSRESSKGYTLHVTCYVEKSTVTVRVVSTGCNFEEKRVEQAIDKLEYPVKAMGTSGEILIFECCVGIECIENDIPVIAWNIMVPMTVVMSEIVFG